MLEAERKRDALLGTSIEPDSTDGLAVPLDPEFRDRLDLREPAAEVAGHGDRLVPDQDQDAVAADPVLRAAPEGESARIVGVVAEDRPIAAQGVGDLGALVPVAREDEGPRIVDQSELTDPIGDLVPAVEVERRIGPGVEEPQRRAASALEPAGAELDDRQQRRGSRKGTA